MQKRCYYYSFFLGLAILAQLTGCATGPKTIPHVNFDQFTMDGKTTATKPAETINFEIEVLSPVTTYDHPELFSVPKSSVPEIYSGAGNFYEKDLDDNYWVYFLSNPAGENDLLAFQVSIKNNASHILRMQGTRIYFVPDGGQPVAPIVSKKDIEEYIRTVEAEWDLTRKRGILSFTYPVGFNSFVFNRNMARAHLVNDVGTEILPDFMYQGLLVFPLNVNDVQSGKLVFYDIVTETDPAGNTITKTKVEFPVGKENVDMWYDGVSKRWKIGMPPVVAAEAK